ncbi:hypothetical protein CHS0354_016287 [Potamilus streckersoni]|uniref:Uncharacterized protein n=1 Tax=Potamilus streckersoni TaxID=2493646 RepID=A0AAE0RXH7_9BIVA|nr:hypothetical protein CHS0354_016287 [Potamilus streckersoni]
MKIRKFKMTAGTLTVVVMASITAVITEKCEKLDPELWDYPHCPHPGSDEWIHLKIKMNCDKDLEYHCASNNQSCDIQQCVKRVYCHAGHRPMLDPSQDKAICKPCTNDRYQTIGFWSNERSDCDYEKTKCDDKVQIECEPGSTTTDRSCRCNIHQNLALESYALHNATCCTNNDPWCYCVNFKSSCPNGTVRHDNYKCLEECPPNSFRQWNSETCYPNSTTGKVEMTTSTVKNITEFNQMTTTTHQISTFRGSPDAVVIGLVVGLIITGILGLALGLWVWHRRKKNNNGPPNDEEQAGPLQDLMTNKGRPGKRTANGHADGREQVDRANEHLVHEEVNSEFQDASTVSEGEATENDQLLESPIVEASLSTKGTRPDLRGNKVSKEETQEESTESVISTDTEPEHRPVEHDERVEQHMTKLKWHTGWNIISYAKYIQIQIILERIQLNIGLI